MLEYFTLITIERHLLPGLSVDIVLCTDDHLTFEALTVKHHLVHQVTEPRAQQYYAAENLATAHQITLNLLKQDTTEKPGIKNKRKACGWSDRYLFHILGLIK